MKEKLEPSELKDWLAATDVLLAEKGSQYAQALLSQISARVSTEGSPSSYEYWNTLTQIRSKVDVDNVQRTSELVRWNAMSCSRLHLRVMALSIASMVSGLAAFFLLVSSERPMTTQPRKENCIRMAMITCWPPPPEWVPRATVRSRNKRRKSSPSRLSQAMALLSTGG